MIKQKILLILSLLIFTQSLFAVEMKTQGTRDLQMTFILPINWSAGQNYNFIITIPEGYRSLQSHTEWMENKIPIIEFIPKNEDENLWTEIITINKSIGQKVPASHMTNYLKNAMIKKVENGRIWKDDVSVQPAYMFSTLGLFYNLNKVREVFGSRYYSGPYDCAGIQYTIRPKKDQTDQMTAAKIEKFFNTNTKIINDDGK
jgi:hypothetical protein